MKVDRVAEAQLYFDRGHGLREADSVVRRVEPDRDLADVDFPLPHGCVRELRFDPMTASGAFTLGPPRLMDSRGRLITKFSLGAISPGNEIAQLRVESQRLVSATTTGATDPQLTIHFAGQLCIKEVRWPWPEATLVFLIVLLTRRYIA